MQLYNIRESINTILDYGFDETCIDPETGEIVPSMADARLQELAEVEGDAIESLALYIKNLNADVVAIKAEADSLAQRKKTKENKAKYLKSFLSEYMQSREIPKYETPRCSLSFRKSESVSIADQKAFMAYAKDHDELLKYKDPEPNKTVIKASIKGGADIPGAKIVTNINLQLK